MLISKSTQLDKMVKVLMENGITPEDFEGKGT